MQSDPCGYRHALGSPEATERRRVKRLERDREDVCRTSRAVHEVLGVIGHELRTPLAGLRAIAECLLAEPDRNSELAASFLRTINDQVARMSEMVNNMLEAARLDSGLAKWSWNAIGLAPVCEDALDVVRPLADDERVRLHCSVTPADCRMHGDADAIRRLVLNLLTNAVKHTPEGEITVEVREAAGPDHRWVQIRVCDTGRGICPDVAENLGRAFATNTGSVGSRFTNGTGLGLAICREIVTAHGGRITVSSSRSRGTTFIVLLRADLAAPATDGFVDESIPLDAAA